MKRALTRTTVFAVALATASCSSPDPKLYTLMPTPAGVQVGNVQAGNVQAGRGPRTVMVRRPGLAGYLDRPDIVRSGGNFQLSLHSGEQWGEPFGELLGRILVEDLSRRLPGSSVYSETGAISADPDATLEIDVQRFDADASGTVTLAVQWSVERGRGNPAGPPVLNRITVTPASSSTADVVAAMSTALGQEADVIATALRALPSAQGAGGQRGRGRRAGR